MFAIVDIGQKQRNFQLQSSLAIGVRRNLSSISTQDLQSVALMDVSGAQSVGRAEVRTRASHVAYANHWFADMVAFDDPLTARLRNRTLELRCIAFSGDASNARIYNNSKIHNMVVDCTYMRAPSDIVKERLPCDSSVDLEKRLRTVPDLQIQRDSSGRGTYRLLNKHLHSVSIPCWDRPTPAQPADDEGHLRTWEVWLYTSNQGPNRTHARKLIAAAMLWQPRRVMRQWSCAMHNPHLLVKQLLESTDAFLLSCGVDHTYLTTLARIVNLRHESGYVFYDIWEQRYGLLKANACALYLLQHCLSGRWHSVFATEERLCAVGRAEFCEVLRAVMHQKLEKVAGAGRVELADTAATAGERDVDEARQRTSRLVDSGWAVGPRRL